MAVYNILRAVSFNDQVMNIIFEVSRALWNSICWNCTKWIQTDFDVSLVLWLDGKLKRRRAKATTSNMALSLKILPSRSLGAFMQMCLSWSMSGSKYDFVAFKRQQEKITILRGNRCVKHRNEMVLCHHYNGMALGVIIPNILRSASRPCYSKCGVQTAGAWGASGSLWEM